ncbi:MAG TPA: hypothetical protein DEA62_05025, partial [Coxiellaceae bacterium]|nr:hypothetical protein [Coxiellaceae bacterium]
MDKKYKQASILAAILLIAGCGLSAVFTGNKKNNHNSSKNNLLKKVIFHKNEKNYLNTSTKQNNQSSDNDTSSDNNTSKGSNIPKKNEMADNYDIFRVETEFKKNIGNSYLPYLQVGGVRFFHVGDADLGGGGDLFIPIWQTHNKLFFTDARFYDRTGGVFEGNIHLGYRYLMPEEQRLYGVYAAFDRRRSGLGNYFNQLTLGGECWIKNWFIGGNVYKPIGKTSVTKSITENIQLRQNGIYRNIWFTSDLSYEKAIPGVDAEVGYEFVKGLVGYVGGYYFDDKDTNSVLGPKAKLTYDFSLNNSKKILGIFDKIGFETGIQNDKPRGTTWYISLNARLG